MAAPRANRFVEEQLVPLWVAEKVFNENAAKVLRPFASETSLVRAIARRFHHSSPSVLRAPDRKFRARAVASREH